MPEGWQIILTIVGSGLFAWFVAWRYGDVAADKAAAKREKEQERQRKLRVLRAFSVEVLRAQDVAKHNAELAPPIDQPLSKSRAFIDFRLSPFDVVFSGEIALEASLLEAMGPFFSQAQYVNSAIREYRALIQYFFHPAKQAGEEKRLRDSCERYLRVIEEYCREKTGKIRPVLQSLSQHLDGAIARLEGDEKEGSA